MKHRAIFSLFCLFLFLNSCDRSQCTNTNPIFNEYEYSDNSYKIELANKIDKIGLENLRTWLADYVEKDGDIYLVFYIQNENLCAKAMVKMNHWDKKMQHIKDKKGKGRVHAEFVDLDFSTQKTSNGDVEFIYKTFNRIID
jgi:tRNA1(Val) A37 N6-methylase TrmN6